MRNFKERKCKNKSKIGTDAFAGKGGEQLQNFGKLSLGQFLGIGVQHHFLNGGLFGVLYMG